MAAMAILLDTCAAIYLMEDEPLAPGAREALYAAGERDGIFVSPWTGWEIGLLSRPDRKFPMRFAPDAATWFARLMALEAIRNAPFTGAIGIDSALLPGVLHNDPADRMLIATARRMGMPIMTRDRRILTYAAEGYVEAIAC